VSTFELVKVSEDEKVKDSDQESENGNEDEEEEKKDSDEESDDEKNESENEGGNPDDQSESDDESNRVDDYQIVPSTAVSQKQPEPSTETQPSKQVQSSPKTLKSGPGTLNMLTRTVNKLKEEQDKQKVKLDKLEGQSIEKAIKEKVPREVKKYLRDNLPGTLEEFVKRDLKEIVSKTLQTTQMTLQTVPAKPTVDELKGQLLEAIVDDPNEAELRKALMESMKKASTKTASCKPPRQPKRRRDDKDPDDRPSEQRKKKFHESSSSRPLTGKTSETRKESSQGQSSSSIQMEETEVPTETAAPMEGVQFDDVPIEDLTMPTNVNEPPKEAQVLPAPEWIDPSAPL
jgi:hypothetical protein